MIEVVPVSTSEQFAAALRLRYEVFVDEQRVDPASEHDEFDDAPGTVHCLAYHHDRCVGVGRLLAPDDSGAVHIGRIAVARGTGVGRAIMDFLERTAVERFARAGPLRIELSGQLQAADFYLGLGYACYGPTYLDEGIEHRAFGKEVAG